MNTNDLILDPIYFEEAARKLGFASATIIEKVEIDFLKKAVWS